MVLMRMADQNGRRSAAVERRRQQPGGSIRSIQRAPRIENEALATRMLDFNAAPTNLVGAAMDGEDYVQADSLRDQYLLIPYVKVLVMPLKRSLSSPK
jgi:hypothetical protein